MSTIAIFGAGGRAGRAITAEALRRGHGVTAVVRDPDRHAQLAVAGVTVERGDVTDAATIEKLVTGHDAVVHAVSPASGPDAFANLDHFDDQFFVRTADALLASLAAAGVPRLVLIGLFANLRDDTGRLLLDAPAVFPPALRPFALAHTAGLDHLRSTDTAVDWLMLTPPPDLQPAGARTGRYRVSGDTLPPDASPQLSYADLAVAAVDEIETPRHHRTRIALST